MYMYNIKPGINRFKIFTIIGIVVCLAGLLSACQVYNGYPVATPEASEATPTATIAVAPVAVLPTLPPPPTLAPRPTLPPVPAGVNPQKTAQLKDSFDKLFNGYFHKLDSRDIYEVSLRSIRSGLEKTGIQNPDVPIPDFGPTDTDNWNSFVQSYSLIMDKYKNQVTEDQLAGFALSGTIDSLHDCQSLYLDPNNAQAYFSQRVSQQQTLTGIGVTLQSGNQNGQNLHVVVRTIPGGPAEKAGLQTGDQVVGIDGTNLADKSQLQTIQLLQGQNSAVGSKVSLTVRRAGTSQDSKVDLNRAKIQIPFIEHGVIDGNIGYIRINRFPLTLDATQLDSNTQLLGSWLADFDKAGITSLILDLRSNSTGSIRLVQNYLSYFLKGAEMVYLAGGQSGTQGAPRKYGVLGMPSSDTITSTDKPLAVLVDGGTQAEAEIFAYTIQHNKRGTIVGDTTGGCPAASSPIALKDNSLINLTTYRLVEDPNSPDKLVSGVEPDQKAALDFQQLLQGKDNQLEAAIKVLKK